MPHARCIEILRGDAAGGGVDPELVERFCQALAVRASRDPSVAGAPQGASSLSLPPSRQDLSITPELASNG
jgi:hypothetical protein